MFENEKKKNCTIFICTKYAIKLGWFFFDLRNSNGKHVFIWSWCVIPFNSWPLFLNSTHNIEIMLFTTTLLRLLEYDSYGILFDSWVELPWLNHRERSFLFFITAKEKWTFLFFILYRRRSFWTNETTWDAMWKIMWHRLCKLLGEE